MATASRVFDALGPTAPDFGAVARSLLGVLAVAAVGLAFNSPSAAVWAAGTAAITGVVSLQNSPGGRVPVVLVATAEMTVAVFLGSLTASHNVLFVIVVAVWCFAAGMQWALGANAGLVAAASAALLVIAPSVAPSLSAVVVSTFLTVAAGCIQAVLVAVRPPQRWRSQRDALSRAYREMADDARVVAADRQTPVDETPLTWLREAFTDIERAKAYHGGYQLPERISATLGDLRGGQTGAEDAVSQMLTAAAAFLDAIADHSHSARREAEHALIRVDAAVALVTEPEAATAKRLSQQLHEAAASRFGEVGGTDFTGSLHWAAETAGAHLNITSPIVRHAMRLSAAAALGIAADRFAPVQHGYWIALTALIVLRPETAHTYTRCIGRVAGIAIGILVASALMFFWQPTGATSAAVAVVFLAATYWAAQLGYIAVSAGVAAVIVFLLDIDPAAAAASIEDRMFAVVIGGGLAVLAHVALPDDALIRLHQRAGELLMTEIDYAATVVRAFVHELDHPADAVSAAWQRAYRARAAFEAASGATGGDSREIRRWLRTYRTALNAVTSACTSLEKSLPTATSTALSPEFVAAVDDYVDALRGAPPTPAKPWTVDATELTTANQKVREQAAALAKDNGAARALVAEVAVITRSLTEIASTYARIR